MAKASWRIRRYSDMTYIEGIVCHLAHMGQGIVGLLFVPFKRLPPSMALEAAKWVARNRMKRSGEL